MLGCEHAWIAAGSLLIAIRNDGKINITDEQIIEALNRTRKQAIGAYCGLTGVCGIAPAIGASFSVILGAACPKDKETAITMKVVSKIIETISNETGPCCCKNFVYSALTTSCILAKEYLDVELPFTHEIICEDTDRHPHGCRKEKCKYYAKQYGNNDIIDNPLQYLMNKSLQLGAEKAKIIDTENIFVGNWVQWKCKYGCPFYGKDGCHPPFAPSTEETRNVLKEYDKALLINGSKGSLLSKIALDIEHEAVELGLYKAFALIALPFNKSNEGST
jgi:Family of unknown function (DUF5714)/Predicted metal-binding protein (DUF2284)